MVCLYKNVRRSRRKIHFRELVYSKCGMISVCVGWDMIYVLSAS